MSRIDELITELCPDGVEYKPLKSISRRTRGATVSAAQMKALHVDGAGVKVFAAGSTWATVPEGTFAEASITREPSVMVKARGNIGLVYCDVPFTHKTELWAYAFGGDETAARFILHYLRTQVPRLQEHANARGGKLPQLSVGDTDDLLVPVPPLAVQQEIVRILDKMEQLEAELEAELEARRKQYEHYRNSLLNFAEAPPEWNVRWTTLGEVLRIRNGRDFKHLGQGTIPVYGSGGIMTYVSDAAHEGPSVLIPRKGSLSNIYFVNEPFWTVDTIFYTEIDETVLLPKFAYYLLVQMDVAKLNVAGGVPSLNQTVLNRQGLAIPSLEVQARIVSTLDAISELAEGFESGLPAEIAARRKQYEFYRDKLLTFPEMSEAAA